MTLRVNFLGGADEIGANSTYLYLDGTGILIDAGLHPVKRDKYALPQFELLNDYPVDTLLLTHSHTDHIGGLPYLLKFAPHVKIKATEPACDISEIMLRDSTKLIRKGATLEFPAGALELYKPETLEKISLLLEGNKYYSELDITGRQGLSTVKAVFYPTGHILGSASVYLEVNGKSILHTSDINFKGQNLLPPADIPKHHLDVLIIENTNSGALDLPDYDTERKKFAAFINQITNQNGSLLIPAFALGKTQEMLKIIFDLQRAGKIPDLPVYTGGMGRIISRIYDRYCYIVPRVQPGFVLRDIPKIYLNMKELMTGEYFKKPSIVLISNGMMNKGTISYRLAGKWMEINRFGVAIPGYVEETTPAYELLHAQNGAKFSFGGKDHVKRCKVEQFRFSSHSRHEDTLAYISDTKPKEVFLIHGDEKSIEAMAVSILDAGIPTKIRIPRAGVFYDIGI